MIPKEKIPELSDEEIRNGGGMVYYVKNPNGGANRITSNYKFPVKMNVPHPEHGKIPRMTRQEAEND